uniref:Major facilitator superfamily associated domain-containing protein n=1 Tax=Globisporangium ultimum (strain ATCC 200006 / CBS 805.95 / DAOM BR144) TaxID=431595 RepID=K3X8I2_GLOUD
MSQPVIIERVSNASNPKVDVNDQKYYNGVQTPDPSEIEGGALRPGGAPNLYSKENIGLLAQYAATGVVYGSLWAVIYPFLNNYLHMTGTETASANALITLPWTWKMFFGIVSDCYPIFGYRRRPYVVIGWFITFVACFIMAVVPIGDPKYGDPALAYIPVADLTREQVAMINDDAPSSGVKYIFLLVLANLGCVIALTASDGILVELAQREPENIRGGTQAMICVTQDIFQCFSAAMIGFGLNSADYGGTFSSAMGYNAVMGVCAFFSLAIIPISWFCMTETTFERQSARKYFVMIYDLLQQRVVYQIIAFRFFRNLFSWFSVTASYPIQSLWARVTPVNSNTATIIGYLVASASYYATKKYGLNWSWRSMLVITQIAVIVIDAIPTFLTIWDVYRAQWFWLGGPIIEYLPNSIGYVISTFAVVEIIEVGNEAAVYGLITTVSTLASPFSTVLSKNVCANFDIDYAFLQVDDTHVREQVSYAYIIAYGFKLFSLVFVFLLPRQKAATQELKRTGGKSKALGILTIVYLIFTFCWSLMTNVMSFSSKTSCLKIAGGSGC